MLTAVPCSYFLSNTRLAFAPQERPGQVFEIIAFHLTASSKSSRTASHRRREKSSLGLKHITQLRLGIAIRQLFYTAITPIAIICSHSLKLARHFFLLTQPVTSNRKAVTNWTMQNILSELRKLSRGGYCWGLEKQSPRFVFDLLLPPSCQYRIKHMNMATLTSPELQHPLLSGGGFQQLPATPLSPPQDYFNRYQYQTPDPQQAPTTPGRPASTLDSRTRFKYFLYRAWFHESLSFFAAFVIFAVLIGLLAAFNGHDLEDAGFYSEVPSSSITFLVTLMRTFMLLPIASGIAQLKWHWFHHQRHPLSDIEVFDDATRGVGGSLRMILKPRFRLVCSHKNITEEDSAERNHFQAFRRRWWLTDCPFNGARDHRQPSRTHSLHR